jgi:hypothetical protein
MGAAAPSTLCVALPPETSGLFQYYSHGFFLFLFGEIDTRFIIRWQLNGKQNMAKQNRECHVLFRFEVELARWKKHNVED